MTRVGLTVHRTFHAIGHSRNFRRFFIGQAFSVSGTWMQMVAAAWLVLRLTNDGVALGIDTALAFGPMLIVGPLGGAFADRHDRRTILLTTQVAFGLLALSLWAIVATGVVPSRTPVHCGRHFVGDDAGQTAATHGAWATSPTGVPPTSVIPSSSRPSRATSPTASRTQEERFIPGSSPAGCTLESRRWRSPGTGRA